MKRMCILLLIVVLLVSVLWGCKKEETEILSPVNFYYPKAVYSYGNADSVLGSEQRETAGFEGNFQYIMNLYLQGPNTSSLVSPFPANSTVVSIYYNNGCAYLVLNDAFAELSGLDLTLACTSLAKTIAEMTNMKSVDISVEAHDLDGSNHILLNMEDILLLDGSTSPTTP